MRIKTQKAKSSSVLPRRTTTGIKVGNTYIGAGAPVLVQSMCNTETSDAKATIKQIKKLEAVGCEIARVAVPDIESARALKKIKSEINIPLAADIHFDYRLALESAKYVDKLRINPGNIGSDNNIKKVVKACNMRKIPIRIGINMGSLEREFEKKYGRTPKAMVESASNHIKILERNNFYDIIVSLKASDIDTTIKACRLFSKKFKYPQHLGITEAGTIKSGAIKSAIGLGILLYEGIGDTIRVSLSGDPVAEIPVAYNILKHLGLKKGLEVIACPTCSRVGLDVAKYAEEVENNLGHIKSNKKIAIMGCVVNGPGEAKDADIAVIGVKGKNPVLFIDGKFDRTINEKNIISEIRKEILE